MKSWQNKVEDTLEKLSLAISELRSTIASMTTTLTTNTKTFETKASEPAIEDTKLEVNEGNDEDDIRKNVIPGLINV